MNVDHFFAIGSSHQSQGRPCEDYALSGKLTEDTVFGVVADGCSGVSAHTDVGARALAWAFQRTLVETPRDAGPWFTGVFGARLLSNFKQFQFGSVPEDYFATMVAFAATQDSVSVLAHGDGAVALRYLDGRMALIELEWADNMPMYLNYYGTPPALAEFQQRYPAEGPRPFQQRTTVFSETAGIVTVLTTEVKQFTLPELLSGHLLQFSPKSEGIECLAVLTDGYAQVGQKLPVEVARECLSYKNFQGEFVKRRMLRALKDFHKEGAVPRDDVGVSAVWFNPTTQL